MSDKEDANLPSADECQNRIVQFTEITNEDEAFAQMSLQEHDWDLAKALDVYWIGQKSTQEASGVSTIPPNNFSLISWNVDGLSHKNRVLRTKSVIDTILLRKPDIVFLQEVVVETLTQLMQHLENYQFVHEQDVDRLPEGAYFTLILLRMKRVYIDCVNIEPFLTSRMSRSLLKVDCHIGKAKLVVMNTHLESGREASDERMKQLKHCFNMVEQEEEGKTVIFGGDLNLRDKELHSCGGVPPNMDDMWILSGSRKECQYTWDMSRNTNLEVV